MTIGQRIREQRRKAELTQEQLAELLSVSPQAVSRWETDAAMPDISLLLPLCNLFGVSADYLLGMETYEKDLRRAEFDEAFKDYWKHDDKEKNYEIACRAAAEYPGDMPYLEWLASAEFYLAFLRGDDAEYRALLESAVGHYRTVLERADDRKLLAQARHGIVLSLHHLGRNAEARAFAEAEEDERKRGEMLVFCLEGEAKRQHCQKLADGALFELLMRLRDIGGLEACDAAERIVGLLFPDGNLGFLHNTLQYNAVQKAFLLCAAQRWDEAVDALRTARRHAEAMERLYAEFGGRTFRYTAGLFDLLAADVPKPETDDTDVDDFLRCLKNNRCFDPLRGRADFQALASPRCGS
ncbi:MAG: hypothetical protein DBY40_02500 [Clostridiales bacterium]|nr:MAG: hypothetical protein DBY40_02500 [Clostridiales bacterium]